MRSRWRLVALVASLCLFGVAAYVLVHTIQTLDPDDLRRGFAEATWTQIGLAIGFTALSYSHADGI